MKIRQLRLPDDVYGCIIADRSIFNQASERQSGQEAGSTDEVLFGYRPNRKP